MGISENHTTTEIDDADKDWIQSSIRMLRRLMNQHMPEEIENYLEPGILDRCLEMSMKDVATGKWSTEDLVPAFGCGFGECLIRQFDFKWLVFSDQYGKDLALYHEKTGIFSFPISSARKRFESANAGTFDAIALVFQEQTKAWPHF